MSVPIAKIFPEHRLSDMKQQFIRPKRQLKRERSSCEAVNHSTLSRDHLFVLQIVSLAPLRDPPSPRPRSPPRVLCREMPKHSRPWDPGVVEHEHCAMVSANRLLTSSAL